MPLSKLPSNQQFWTKWSPPKRVVKEYRAEKIPVYGISKMTYQVFVWYHLIPNQPCIIQFCTFFSHLLKKILFKNNLKYSFYNIKKKKRNMSNDWNITKDWLHPSTKTESLLSTNYVKTKFGDATVTVANCGEKGYSDQKRTEMTLSEYMNYWESKQAKQRDIKEEYIIPHIQKEVNGEQMQWIFDRATSSLT
ncbi:hypothetical protein RFI_07618 [Reticulomyxa filosa]|uniref:Uncharacterized protein n=1 Tax=Reticulomyxa filosa TaxID=46433 RepID=X6NUA4_RETFI|nr:hypothetical protein RFI_07618 [Reticulomyxa filosa]|eukprot:ETO29508.1 hypothetical protein RFI_07618 [Reticulomyxa filosa]